MLYRGLLLVGAVTENTKLWRDLSFFDKQITSCLPSAVVLALADYLFEDTFEEEHPNVWFFCFYELCECTYSYLTQYSLIIDCFIQLLPIKSLLDSVCNCHREVVALKCYDFSLKFWQNKHFISRRWNQHKRKRKLSCLPPPSWVSKKPTITAASSVKLV